MSRVGQISLASPGEPLELFFSEGELRRVLEEKARPGDHVTMYPGDYTDFDENDPIKIERDVSVTILPGATIDYEESYQTEPYGRDDPGARPSNVTDSEGLPAHPLSPETGLAKRYLRPNFSGHVENIVDMNFGSEWAFKTDLQDNTERIIDLEQKTKDHPIAVDIGYRSQGPLELAYQGAIEFIQEDGNVLIDYDTVPAGENENPYDKVQIKFSRPELDDVVTKVVGGEKVVMTDPDQSGNPNIREVQVNHEETNTTGNLFNSGTTFVQDIEVDKFGHIENVEAVDKVTIENREPRPFEGGQKEIWLAEELQFFRDIYLRTKEPDRTLGEEGDVWIVNDEDVTAVGKPGLIRTSDLDPTTSDGNEGDVWLSGSGITADQFEIQEVFFKQRSPDDGVDGQDRDIWTTENNQ